MTTKTKKDGTQCFDVRVVDQKIRRHQLDPKEYEAFLKSLPDDESRADYMEVYEEPKDEQTPMANALTFTSA